MRLCSKSLNKHSPLKAKEKSVSKRFFFAYKERINKENALHKALDNIFIIYNNHMNKKSWPSRQPQKNAVRPDTQKRLSLPTHLHPVYLKRIAHALRVKASGGDYDAEILKIAQDFEFPVTAVLASVPPLF